MTGAHPHDSAELYGIDNLPYGVFVPADGTPRIGVRFGDDVIDVAELLGDDSFRVDTLNPFMRQGAARWAEVRAQIQQALAGSAGTPASHALERVQMVLPFDVADYVDFYASEQHATNLGRLFRPNDPPLLPNWKHLPVSYHGRAGTVVVSGTDIVRPQGQRRVGGESPEFGPSTRLDIEAELGFVVGSGTALGDVVSPDDFARHVFGVVLLNDWSARDIQAWEYVPLGPHLGKSFATSISPWVVPLAALTGAAVDGPPQEPQPLPHLRQQQPRGYDVDLLVEWNGQEVSRPPYRDMYWSPAQMFSHMSSNGATLRTGDLFGSGTISGSEPNQRGSFIELSWNGQEPVQVGDGQRSFLVDGDVVTLRASAPSAAGGRIGLGEVTGRILPARPSRHDSPENAPAVELKEESHGK